MSAYTVVFIYFISFLFIGFDFTNVNRKYKVYIFNIICLLLVILASLKTDDFSYDTQNYIMLYENAPPLRMFIPYANGYEPGWVLLGIFCRYLGLNYHVFFFLVASLSIGIYRYVILKKCDNIFFALFTYISCFYFLNEIIILRHGLAAAFVFLEMYFIAENNKRKAFLCLLIGISMHSTAFIGVLPFCIKLNTKPIYYFFILLLTIVINDTVFIYFISLYADRYNLVSYINIKINNYLALETAAGGIQTFILYSFDMLLMFLLTLNISGEKKQNRYFSMIIIGFLLSNFFMLSFTRIASFARLNALFLTNRIPLSSYYLTYFKRNRKEFVIVLFFIIINFYIFLRQNFFNSGGTVFL